MHKRSIYLLLFIGCLLGLVGIHFILQKERETALADFYKDKVTDHPGLSLKIKEINHAPQPHVIQTLDLASDHFQPFQKDRFIAEVSGFLKIKKSGLYSLELASDDDSALFIDGKEVIDNRGYHALQSKKANTYLIKGFHHIYIKHINREGLAALKFLFAQKGHKRKIAGQGDLYLPVEASLTPIEAITLPPFPGNMQFELIPSQKQLYWNQLRGCLFLIAFISILLFFWSDRLFLHFKNKETWIGFSLFLIALSYRLIYYLGHTHLQIQGLFDGGDNHYFLMLPLRFVTNGEFISINCGNLPLLIPLLGTLYKYFHFFPGIQYYSILMILLGSVITLLPWLLLKNHPARWAGLLAGLFLAVNPILVEIKNPYVSSDLLGLFTFSIALFFSIRALLNQNWSSYLLAGFTLALLPLSRTVFIPLAVVLIFSLFILSKKKWRALISLLIFLGLLIGYDWYCYPTLKESYFLRFIIEGVSAASDSTGKHEILHTLLPLNLIPYLKLISLHSLPLPSLLSWFNWSIPILLIIALVKLFRQSPRLFFFLGIAGGVYLYELSSYYVAERYCFPFISVIGLTLALGFGFSFQKSKMHKIGIGLFVILFGLSLWQVCFRAYDLREKSKKQTLFLNWVQERLPKKSILLTDEQAPNPWLLYRHLKIPIFYGITRSQTLVIYDSVIQPAQVRLLAAQAQITKTAPPLVEHRYTFDGMSHMGYRYFIIQEDFANRVLKTQPLPISIPPLSLQDYQLVKIASYPKDKAKGIWELQRIRKQTLFEKEYKIKDYPANFDRFLKPKPYYFQ